MKKALFLLSLCLLLLCGCAKAEAPPAQTPPAPKESPAPLPTELVLGAEGAEEILSLASQTQLEYIDAGASREYDALIELSRLLPRCRIVWEYELDGQALSSEDESLILSSTDGLEEALLYLPGLKSVDLLGCDVSIEELDRFSALRPDIDFLCWLDFGSWRVRSDITCFSTLRTGSNHRYTSEELYPLLRYCTGLRALDLGHNDLTDISLIGNMPELQVLILADNPRLCDISALAGLTELHYLELFLCKDIEDFSPLYELTKMQDMNLSYCRNLEDIGFIDNMPDFRMGWFRDTHVTREQANHYTELMPEVTIVRGSPADPSSVIYGWRSTERSRCIRHAFSNWDEVLEYRHWSDVEYMK